MTANVLFTTSWDDGHPLDARVAEMLDRHGFAGTFYLPVRNVEDRPVMPADGIRRLAERFEIGSHTFDHAYLDGLPPNEITAQISAGKSVLEDIVGQPVAGFAYPGGRHTAAIRAAVRRAGFYYARTTENLTADPGNDPFAIPTTFQLYPHRRITYVKNYAKYRHFGRRLPMFGVSLERAPDLLLLMRHALSRVVRAGGVFHLWGHSWELEARNLWQVFDQFLTIASELIDRTQRVTNGEILARAFAVGKPQPSRGERSRFETMR